MKNVILNKNQENRVKVFTKKKVSNTIKKNYNPLKVNYKRIYERGSGLYNMKKTKEVKEELSKKYNKSESYIGLLTKICLDLNINNYRVAIEDFLKN